MLLSLFELVPVWPAVLYCVGVQNIKARNVLVVGIMGKAMERLALILFCELLHQKDVFKEIVFVCVGVLVFKHTVITDQVFRLFTQAFSPAPERPAHYHDARVQHFL